MRCIFCKLDSRSSVSAEHIVPESMGGFGHILPPRVVCDRCNNYFSREVEKPFLECDAISLLRFHQRVANKRGRVPPAEGMVAPGHFPVTLYRHPRVDSEILVVMPPEAAEHVQTATAGRLYVRSEAELPSGAVVSRFLAKVAVEAMADRLVSHPDGLEYLVDEVQLDPIRNHARRGDIRVWPTSVRQIYHADAKWLDDSDSARQVVNEYDILVTENNEWYFILAIFGKEFAINYGGPDIDGYKQWLDLHKNVSPLYFGKNTNDGRLRPSV
jgi:hypothetical protein